MIDIYRYEAMDFDVIRHHYYIQNSCLVHNISTNLLLSLALSKLPHLQIQTIR